MGMDIAIRLPENRNPTAMPSLPGWVESRLEIMNEGFQPDQAGKYRPIMTIPQSLILSQLEQQELKKYVGRLQSYLEQTPAQDAQCETKTLAALTKMMLVLPASKASEAGIEAIGEAYLGSLEDIPYWAVIEAIKKWFRGESAKTDKHPHDFRWRPAPAILRKLSQYEMRPMCGRITKLENLLEAEPLIEYADDHCREMQTAVSGLFKAMAAGKITDEFTKQDAINNATPLSD